jgi:hypothetical protein
MSSLLNVAFSLVKEDPGFASRDTRWAEPPVDFLAVCLVLTMVVLEGYTNFKNDHITWHYT